MNLLNASFELVAALLAWRSVQELRQAGCASGVYWPQFAFSALWAVECVPYYLTHGDTWSAGLAAVRCAGLATWTMLAVRS